MKSQNSPRGHLKISAPFRNRLARLAPGQRIRVIAVLETGSLKRRTSQRQSREERKATLDSVRKSAQSALRQIDKTLKQFDGKRLQPEVNALGTVAVETTVAGVHALARSKSVRAILEDQPISLLT